MYTLVKPLLIYAFCLAISGCGTKKSVVNLQLSSLTEVEQGKTTHGCLVNASKGKQQFVQTVNYEYSEINLNRQYSFAQISINPDTNQVELLIYCQASHPHMLKNTSLEFSVFDRMSLFTKLDIEERFQSNDDRDSYLQELVRKGFSFTASAWTSSYLDVPQIPTNSPLFQSSESSGYFNVPYGLLGIRPQTSPNCSGGFFSPIEVTIEVPPQTLENVIRYQYIDPSLRSLRQDVGYIPEWRAFGTIKGSLC